MNYIVAVSGGVDSVVLLDILARKKTDAEGTNARRSLQGEERVLELTSKTSAEGQTPPKIIVAHVDHGIRPESADDERFVRGLAKQHRLPYVSTRLELGESASEEQARTERYNFLFLKAREFKAEIVTAHHQDDAIGSIAINLIRGTGWRGLAVMNRSGITRPLLTWNKQKIYDYALMHKLEWVEDATNQSSKYLRNRLRAGIKSLPGAERSQLNDLRVRQLQIAREINRERDKLIKRFQGSRYHYQTIDRDVAIELLRGQFMITTTQADLALLAIKTAKPGTSHHIGSKLSLRFSASEFIVETHL